jgi:hypothetical protein
MKKIKKEKKKARKKEFHDFWRVVQGGALKNSPLPYLPPDKHAPSQHYKAKPHSFAI